MQKIEIIELPFLLLDYLGKNSDAENPVTMSEILKYLSDNGATFDRRTVYKAIGILNQHGYMIHFTNNRGYWLENRFSPAEIYFLRNLAERSGALSETETKILTDKLGSLISDNSNRILPAPAHSAVKTDNTQVLPTMDCLLKAIAKRNYVSFLYYDITITKKKSYRRQREKYILVPYAILSNRGRFYCIMYAKQHEKFLNFRIDKMEDVSVLAEQEDPVFFNLDDYVRSSFDMYHGDPQTITAEFDNSLSNYVFEQFGKDILISKVSDKSFTASIQTSLTPTLVSWIIQFYDKIKIIHPQDLIDNLLDIAKCINHTYQK